VNKKERKKEERKKEEIWRLLLKHYCELDKVVT
jgi:hypothetical protein